MIKLYKLNLSAFRNDGTVDVAQEQGTDDSKQMYCIGHDADACTYQAGGRLQEVY